MLKYQSITSIAFLVLNTGFWAPFAHAENQQPTSTGEGNQHQIAATSFVDTLDPEHSKDTLTQVELCILEQIRLAATETKVEAIRTYCQQKAEKAEQTELSPLKERLKDEMATLNNPAIITPHKRNYLLPVTYVDKPNDLAFSQNGESPDLDHFEAKFQISFKAPIKNNLLLKNDVLFFGFTLQSYWQMYNSDISSPFRETNYQPEVFYGFVNDFQLGDWTNLVNIVGIEHQSNGRTQPLSRSWNRIYAQIVWENNDWVFMFKPWYRIPEKEKTAPNQPDGDDNPDINDYMGFFEFSTHYRWEEQTFSMMFRNNLDTQSNHGALQLDWTFPMGKRFKGYAELFHGYGESLIDYNHKTSRLGIGVLLTDIF